MRHVPVAVVGSARQPEVPWIGAAAHGIRQDMVYLDQMPRVTAASGLPVDVAAASAVPLPYLSSHGRRNGPTRSARLRRRSSGDGRAPRRSLPVRLQRPLGRRSGAGCCVNFVVRSAVGVVRARFVAS